MVSVSYPTDVCVDGRNTAAAGPSVAGAVWSVALTADGRRVVTASEDFTGRVWDVVSGNCAHVLDGHTGWVVHVCTTADGLRCATASHDGTARSAGYQSHQDTSSLVHAMTDSPVQSHSCHVGTHKHAHVKDAASTLITK